MKTLLTILFCLSWAYLAEAQAAPSAQPSAVSISAKGDDVRRVLADLFAQAKKDFVLEPNIRYVLYLSLTDVEFEDALRIVLRTAELKYELQDGIYFISKKKPVPVVVPPLEPQPKPTPAPEPPKGKLPAQVLSKVVTTRLSKTDLRETVAKIGRQAGITIEVAETIPRYKVDAFFIKTSVKYALDVLSRALGVRYVFTDRQTLLLTNSK
jgi:type II secretory pathway component GspD/PulD (secretin)